MAAPDTSTYVLVSGDSGDLPNSRVLAVDDGLGLSDNGTNITITPENTLGAIQELAGTGFITLTGVDTVATRTITSGGTISVTNPGGIAGNVVLDVAAGSSLQLINILEGGSSVGNTSKLNLIAGTGAGISCVTNGDRIDCTYTATADASINAPYWVSTDTPSLPEQVNIGALTTGVLGVTVTTGVATPSIVTHITDSNNSLYIGTDTMTGASDRNANVVIGTGAGQNATSSALTIIGYQAGQNIATFNGVTVIGSSGIHAATNASTATAVGANSFLIATNCAGSTALGYGTGDSQGIYNSCTLIGNAADCSANNLTNAIAIGAGAIVGASNTMVLGANGTKVVIGDTTAQNGNYALNIDETGSSASVWMGRSASQTTPTLAGGVFSIDSSDAPRYTAGPAGFSGSIIVASTANGTSGQVLKANGPGVAPSWASDTGFANPMTTAGDLILGGASGTPSRLAIGSNNFVLTSNGTTATWAANAATTVASGQATLTAGASGTITLAGVTGTSKIVVSYYGTTSDPGILSVTLGTGNFTINSSNAADASTVAWHAIV